MIMDKKVKQRSDLEECATSSSQVHEKSFSKMLFIHLRRSTSLLLGSVLKCDWSKTEWVALRTTITHYCCLEHTILSIHIAHLSCKKKIKQKMYLNDAYFILDHETFHHETHLCLMVQGPVLARRLEGSSQSSLGPQSADSSEESSCSSWWLVLSLSQLCVLE